ncbi:tyrosine-type recombinase/integrase [Mesorhizobium hawassense]|nr:integrase arm-type DNA-binding domain-containing protein [Mesorhizobium hawassense]
MARAVNKLTDTWLKRAQVKPGIYSDGGSLYLRVAGDTRSWFYIYVDGRGKRREMGLGGYPSVSLSIAREKARDARDVRAKGLDPIEHRKAAKEAAMRAERQTFGCVADEFITANSARWVPAQTDRYKGYCANWLKDVVGLPVETVDDDHVVDALRPVWGTPTGAYLRSFIERVLDFSVAKRYRPKGLNPARIKGHIAVLLPQPRAATVHHAALAWAGVGDVMRSLQGMAGEGARAFRLTILCGLRQKEARELRWRHVKDDRLVFPASEYKTRREHVVPLSAQAKAVLAEIKSNREPEALVFKGRLHDRPLSSHTFEYLLADLELAVKPHGFRTSLAVWGVEAGGFADDIMQRCLGHVVGTEVSRAYQRSDFFEAKRGVFDAWGNHCIAQA